MSYLFIFLLIIFIFLEGTVTTLPLVLIYLLCLTILKRDSIIFSIAFFAGLLLDLLTARSLGMSSIFFTVFVFLLLLYRRKYEINSYPFVFSASLIGACVFLVIFGYGNWFMEALLSAFVAVLLFGMIRIFTKRLTVSLD